MFWCNMESWQRHPSTRHMFIMSDANIRLDTRHGYWLDQLHPMLSNTVRDRCKLILLFRNIETKCSVSRAMGRNNGIGGIDCQGGGICKWYNMQHMFQRISASKWFDINNMYIM